MFSWALLRLWGSLRASTHPQPRDPVAAGERIRALGALPIEQLLRTLDGDGTPEGEALTADLVALAAGAGISWHDRETVGAMAEVLAAIGLNTAASGGGRRAMDEGDRIQAESHVLRGIHADRTWGPDEAHRQFATAAHLGTATGNPVAVALGRLGMIATADRGTDAVGDVPQAVGDARDSVDDGRDSLGAGRDAADRDPGAVDRALEPLGDLARGPAVDEVRRALRVRASAQDVARRSWDQAETGPARESLERWLREHRDEDADELYPPLIAGLVRSIGNEDAWTAPRARLIDEVLAAYPRLVVFQDALARLAHDRDRPALEVEVLEPLYEDRPGDTRTTVRLALAYRSTGRDEDAVRLLRASLSDPPVPGEEGVLSILAFILGELGSPEAAFWDAHLARLRGSEGGFVELLPTAMRGGFVLSPAPLLAHYEDGSLTIDPAAGSLPPFQVQAHILAAICAGSPDGGEQLATLVEQDPEMAAEVARLLGVALDAPPALSDRADVDELLRRGDEHFQRRELTEAAACYSRAREVDPDSAMALLWLGDVHFVQQEKSVARVYFEESLATEETPMAWRFLADTLADDPATVERARACYERALEMDPGYGGARQGLASLPPAPAPVPAAGPESLPVPGPLPVPEPLPVPGPPPARVPAPGASGPLTSSPSLLRRSFHLARGVLRRPSAGAKGPVGGPAAPAPMPPPLPQDLPPRPAVPPAPAVSPAPAAPPAPSPQEPQDDSVFRQLSASGIQARLPEALEAVMREQNPAVPELLDHIEDDGGFARWQERWLPEHFGYVYAGLLSLAWQWNSKAGNPVRALLLARRRVQVAECLADQWGGSPGEGAGRALLLSEALGTVAHILQGLGRYSEAYAELQRAETWLETDRIERERVGRPLEALLGPVLGGNPRVTLYEELAAAAERCGEEQAAEGYRERAREWSGDVPGSDHTRILQMIYEADTALERGEVDHAFWCFDGALPLAEREAAWSPVKQALAVVHHFRGKALLGLGLHRTALRHIAEARGYNAGNADRLATDWMVTADILSRRSGLGDPLEAYEHVLHLSGVPGRDGDPFLWRPRRVPGGPIRIEHPERAWRVIGPMARAAWDAGDPETATAVLELGVDLADLVRTSQTDPALRRTIQDERAEVYELLTRYRIDGYGSTEAAFTVSERLRARSLLDALSTSELRAPADAPAELLAREAALLRERTAVEQAPGTDWALHHDIGKKLAAVWTAIADRCPEAEEYVAIRRSEVTTSGAALAELAGERVVVASYAQLGDGRTVLFTLDPRTGLAVTDIEADGDQMLRFIADNLGSAGQVAEMAVDMPGLFHRVLGPLVAPLTGLTAPGDTVLICPTGALHNVPFHALAPDGAATLLDRNPVGYLPSVSLLRTLGHRTAGTGSGAVVLGDPGGDLPHARSEAQLLGARLGTPPLIGAAATRGRVLRDMSGAEVLHAACHAFFDPDDPLSSGLVLADGLLTGHDMLRQDWHGVRLAVLSACETGLGRTGRTDETLGLSRALLLAGVRSLIMSLWRVPDATTAVIMGDFHDLTLAGEPPDRALRTAMLAARDRPGGERLDRWAAFCLLGEWRAPHTPGKGATDAGHRRNG